jgi:hypothetical protein
MKQKSGYLTQEIDLGNSEMKVEGNLRMIGEQQTLRENQSTLYIWIFWEICLQENKSDKWSC